MDKGKVSSKEAKEKAIDEYKKFRPIQDRDYVSDFDKMIDEIRRLNG